MTWGDEMGLKAESKHSAWVFFIDTLRGSNMPESSSLWAFAQIVPAFRLFIHVSFKAWLRGSLLYGELQCPGLC